MAIGRSSDAKNTKVSPNKYSCGSKAPLFKWKKKSTSAWRKTDFIIIYYYSTPIKKASKPWENVVFLAQQHLDHQLWNSSVYISRFLRVQQLCQIGQKSIVFLIDISNIDIFAPLIFLYLFVGKMKLLHDKCLTCSIWLPKNLSSVAGNPNGWSSYFSKKVASLNIPWPPLSRIIGDVTSMSPTLHHLFAPVNEGPGSMKVVKQIEAGYSVHTEMWG